MCVCVLASINQIYKNLNENHINFIENGVTFNSFPFMENSFINILHVSLDIFFLLLKTVKHAKNFFFFFFTFE